METVTIGMRVFKGDDPSKIVGRVVGCKGHDEVVIRLDKAIEAQSHRFDVGDQNEAVRADATLVSAESKADKRELFDSLLNKCAVIHAAYARIIGDSKTENGSRVPIAKAMSDWTETRAYQERIRPIAERLEKSIETQIRIKDLSDEMCKALAALMYGYTYKMNDSERAIVDEMIETKDVMSVLMISFSLRLRMREERYHAIFVICFKISVVVVVAILAWIALGVMMYMHRNRVTTIHYAEDSSDLMHR